MPHRVRLFASLRELAGTDWVELHLPAGSTVADAVRELGQRHAPLAEPLARMSVVMAVNREYAESNQVLEGGDELALIPPVSGGAGERDRGRR